MKIKKIMFYPKISFKCCSLMSCNRKATWEAIKTMKDGSKWKNRSCDAHLSANLNILREDANLHWDYWRMYEDEKK